MGGFDAGYQFAIEFFGEQGSVGQVAVTADWEPAFECVRFAGMRRGRLPAVAAGGPGTIEPIWHEDAGAPYVAGVRAVVANGGWASDIPGAWFRQLAKRAATRLVEDGILDAGISYRYRVCAFPRNPVAPDGPTLDVEPVVEPLPLVDSALEPFFRRAIRAGSEPTVGEDMPVFIARQVLEEARAIATSAGDVETGGILVGRLHRDTSRPEIFLEVTAQIPAEHAPAERTKITFTAETWTAARAAIELRKQAEIMTGWWHLHPDFCRNCPPEKRSRCTLRSTFFSAEDMHLHRVCFVQPWAVALLLSDGGSGDLGLSLFGWRDGMVVARDFHVTESASNATGKPTNGGHDHAQNAAG